MTSVMLIVLFAIIFCLGKKTHGEDLLTNCPSPDEVQPCNCGHRDDGITLECKSATYQVIQQALEKMKNHDISLFSFWEFHSNVPVPGDALHWMSIRELWITESKFSFASDHLPLDGLQKVLKKLIIRNSHIGFPGLRLNHLAQLAEFWVQSIDIPTLKAEWVRQWPQNIESLTIMSCGIRTLEPSALKPLAKLKRLILSNNAIVKLERSVLAENLNELLVLALDDNRMEQLDELFFKGMPKLMSVNLNANRLTTMPYPTWEIVWHHLGRVYLEDNPFDCTHKHTLSWLCEQRLPRSFSAQCKYPEDKTGLQLGSKEFCN